MPEVGVLLCGHGTRNAEGVREFLDLTDSVKKHLDGFIVTEGFLELAEPSLEDRLDALRQRGCSPILVLPAMLFAAGHLKIDLPGVLADYAGRYPGVALRLGRSLGVDARMVRAAADRVRQAPASAPVPVAPEETGLLMVARGSSDPDANADAMKMMRLIWEGLGLGWAEIGYCDVTFPHVEPALDRLARQGFRRIVVLPYLLFTGVLIGRLREWIATAARRYPDIAFDQAPYLQNHPEIAALYAERVREALRPVNPADCCVCKYRSPLPGFEPEAASEDKTEHADGAGRGGGESQPKRPYPFAGHPAGPKARGGARPTGTSRP